MKVSLDIRGEITNASFETFARPPGPQFDLESPWAFGPVSPTANRFLEKRAHRRAPKLLATECIVPKTVHRLLPPIYSDDKVRDVAVGGCGNTKSFRAKSRIPNLECPPPVIQLAGLVVGYGYIRLCERFQLQEHNPARVTSALLVLRVVPGWVHPWDRKAKITKRTIVDPIHAFLLHGSIFHGADSVENPDSFFL